MTDATVTLREITDANREAVLALEVGPGQERFVAGVEESIREAAETPEGAPWYRAIYAGEDPVGFVILSWNVTPQPGIIGPWFLCRFPIDERFHGRGICLVALHVGVCVSRAVGGTQHVT